MKKMLLIVVCCISICGYSQRVAINADGSAPHASAILDVKSPNKGFLPPRIALTGSTDVTTIASPATGLFIYNTASAGSDPNTVSPGFYYYNGTSWVSLSPVPAPASWLTGGNNASADDYIGTSNFQNLQVRVNGVASGLIDQFDGNAFWGHRSGLNNSGTQNTAVGANALPNNTFGTYNTAIGFNTLNSNSIGEFNSAIGAGALYSNISGSNNTANGVAALYSNTTGGGNTANGAGALYSNTSGSNNTATGQNALNSNSTGIDNTANGSKALQSNTTGEGNTANGSNALQLNSTGQNNTATGTNALQSNSTGQNNTANGSNALLSNTTGQNNTANGSNALQSNTTGQSNTANGVSALLSNTTGQSNTATGLSALEFNSIGRFNTANGDHALYNNTSGESNTANGISALLNNNTGGYNVANGSYALRSNTSGEYNTAMGNRALHFNDNGKNNTALGAGALYNNTSGENNIALGVDAGYNLTAGNNNIVIGNSGVAAESSTTRIGTAGTHLNTFIAGIRETILESGEAVYVTANGQLGIIPAPAFHKENTEEMSTTSDDLLKLHPVSFVYKDAAANNDKTIQYGLIAEEVAKINPALVTFDKDGKPRAVRYQMLTPMLVNELQKEHKINEEQNEKIQALQKQLDELKLLIGKLK